MFTWVTTEVWRRMLRQAFEPLLGLDGVHDAIAFWHANYDDLTDVHKSIRPFVQHFSSYIEQPELKARLTLQLIAALHSPLNALPADPSNLEVAHFSITPDPQPTLFASPPQGHTTHQPHPVQDRFAAPIRSAYSAPAEPSTLLGAGLLNDNDATLKALMRGLLTAIQGFSNGALASKQFLESMTLPSNLKEMGLQGEQSSTWVLMARSGFLPDINLNVSNKQCTAIISTAYIFLTELMGPVDADRLLSDAVNQVERMPEGKARSPRLFL
jgi:hypothetical protein